MNRRDAGSTMQSDEEIAQRLALRNSALFCFIADYFSLTSRANLNLARPHYDFQCGRAKFLLQQKLMLFAFLSRNFDASAPG
jgi:hypothetical protein